MFVISDPIMVAIIAGLFGLPQAFIGYRQSRQGRTIEEIHVLTNSNLTRALNERDDAIARADQAAKKLEEAMKVAQGPGPSVPHLEGPTAQPHNRRSTDPKS